MLHNRLAEGQGEPGSSKASACLPQTPYAKRDAAPTGLSLVTKLIDSSRVDDGKTNSVLFHLSVWPSSVPFGASDGGRVDVRQTNSVLFDLSVWPSSAHHHSTACIHIQLVNFSTMTIAAAAALPPTSFFIDHPPLSYLSSATTTTHSSIHCLFHGGHAPPL